MHLTCAQTQASHCILLRPLGHSPAARDTAIRREPVAAPPSALSGVKATLWPLAQWPFSSCDKWPSLHTGWQLVWDPKQTCQGPEPLCLSLISSCRLSPSLFPPESGSKQCNRCPSFSPSFLPNHPSKHTKSLFLPLPPKPKTLIYKIHLYIYTHGAV